MTPFRVTSEAPFRLGRGGRGIGGRSRCPPRGAVRWVAFNRLRRMNAPDPAPDAAAAAAAIADATGLDRHDMAVVLGSGWRPAADAIGTAAHELAMADLPGFLPPIVAGHGGTI